MDDGAPSKSSSGKVSAPIGIYAGLGPALGISKPNQAHAALLR